MLDHFLVAVEFAVVGLPVFILPDLVEVAGVVSVALHAGHVVRVGIAEVVIESLAGGKGVGVVAEVPLADTLRGVAAILEEIRDGDFVGMQRDLRLGTEDARHGNARLVATGHERGAGRGANAVSGVEVGEAAAFLCDAIDVRRLDVRRAKAGEVLVALVVGVNDDDVGEFVGRGRHEHGSEEQKAGVDAFHGREIVATGMDRANMR